MSDCNHLFLTNNTPCVHCNRSLLDVQVESGNPPEAQGTERATPLALTHQHVFRTLSEPCVVCHASYEQVVKDAGEALVLERPTTVAVIDVTEAKADAIELTGETELVGLQGFLDRGGIVYCNNQPMRYAGVLSVPTPVSSNVEGVSVAGVRQALRFVAFYGSQLDETELAALIQELSLAGARLRELQKKTEPVRVRGASEYVGASRRSLDLEHDPANPVQYANRVIVE